MHPLHPHLHETFLWVFFFIGALVYMAKRAFYLITGPNPVANNVEDFVKVAGVPLLFRFVVDSTIYWMCFTPEILQSALTYFGWTTSAYVISVITQFGACALMFGLCVDIIADWGIGTIVGKIPILKDFWAQMPGPIKSASTNTTSPLAGEDVHP